MDPDAVAIASVEHYYSTFDANRSGLANLYQDSSMLTFEGQKILGSQNIVTKLTSLPFSQCRHNITTVDCQPSGPAAGMLVFVSGTLQLAGGLARLFAQEWEGDVTVVMPATLAQYSKIIQNPSHSELQKAANQCGRCTWEKLSAIKANCGIELALDECVAILNHMRRLRSAERAAAASHGLASTIKFSASKRIPSWNCIARENSTGSLQEEFLADVTSSLHHGVSGSTGPPGWNRRTHRNVHDASDSESESADEAKNDGNRI